MAAIEKSNVCGLSRSTASSRFCSMARAVTSSSVSSTSRPAGSGGAVGRVWSSPAARAAANCCAAVRAISSRRARSGVSCATAPPGASEANNRTAAQEWMRFFMVVASKSGFRVSGTGLGATFFGRLVQRGEPGPLVAREGLAHVHEHLRAALVEGGARRFDGVDLLHRRLVAALKELCELCFRDVERCLQLFLSGQRPLENLLETPRLFGGQSELLLELLVLPPLEALAGGRMREQEQGRGRKQRGEPYKRLRELHG